MQSGRRRRPAPAGGGGGHWSGNATDRCGYYGLSVVDFSGVPVLRAPQISPRIARINSRGGPVELSYILLEIRGRFNCTVVIFRCYCERIKTSFWSKQAAGSLVRFSHSNASFFPNSEFT